MPLLPLNEAIATHLHDGDSVALEGFTHLIPFAAGHEIIRQKRRNLHLIRMTPDLIYDQLIGMGCAARLTFSWGGNPGVGSLHRLRDAVERQWPQPLALTEFSHAELALAYQAGASGMSCGLMPHHADSDLDVSTSFRHHPIEFVVGSGIFWLALVITGFRTDIAAAYLICASILSCVQHGNIGLLAPLEPVLQRVVVTPDMHRLHHSLVSEEANTNFGFVFSFWDRLFATHRQIPRPSHEIVQFGLREFRNPSFPQMLLLPLKLRQANAYSE